MSSYHYSFYSPHGLHCLGFLPQISLLAEDILPQISQIYTELLAECILPQISQIYTEVRLPSRGCTCLKCTNRARSAPTKQEVHQPSKIDILPRNPQNPQNFLQSVFSHRFHRFTQMIRLPSRGCTCLKCTNQANSGSPTDFTDQHRWLGCER